MPLLVDFMSFHIKQYWMLVELSSEPSVTCFEAAALPLAGPQAIYSHKTADC